MNDNKFWLILWTLVLTTLVMVVSIICYAQITTRRTMIEAGYEYGAVPYTESKVFIDWHKQDAKQ